MANTKQSAARRNGPATADRLKKKSARTQRVHISLDDDLAQEVEDLKRQAGQVEVQLRRARRDAKKAAPGTGGAADAEVAELAEELELKQAELEAAREALRKETVTLVFRSIGRKKFEALRAEHPATAAQKREAKEKGQPAPDFDVETFPAALVAVSCESPDLTSGAYEDEDEGRTRYPDAEEIFESWNDGELGVLFTAAYQVNTQRQVVDLGEG